VEQNWDFYQADLSLDGIRALQHSLILDLLNVQTAIVLLPDAHHAPIAEYGT